MLRPKGEASKKPFGGKCFSRMRFQVSLERKRAEFVFKRTVEYQFP